MNLQLLMLCQNDPYFTAYQFVFILCFRGDAQAKVDRKKLGKEKLSKGTFHKKLTELKKKVKNTALEADSCDEGMLWKQISLKIC